MWKATITDCWRDGLSRDEQKRLLLLSFGAVFFFGLAAHAYGFLRAGFSHDMLNALVVEPVETYWKMQLGRPGIVLYRRTVRGLIAAPWMLGLLSLLWLSLACFLTVKLFQIRNPWFVVLAGGILAANLSTVAMTATFLYEMDADCFALLLGVIAVLLWDRGRWPGTLIGVLFTAACMGIYQSMISIPITLVMLLSIAALLRGEAFRPTFLKGLRALIMLALGGLLYWLGVRLMCSWKGINLALDSYYDADLVVTHHLFIDIGQAEAAFLKRHHVAKGLDELGVDEHLLEALAFRIVGIEGVAVDDEQADGFVDLGCSQTDAFGMRQRLPHVLQQDVQLGIVGRDGLGDGLEGGVTVCDYW